MMHKLRRWCLRPVATPQDLARMLTTRTWPLCSAFGIDGHPAYLFLNDATLEGAGGFAVLQGPYGSLHFQIASIMFRWMTYSEALMTIEGVLAGRMDSGAFSLPVVLHVDTAAGHTLCPLCS